MYVCLDELFNFQYLLSRLLYQKDEMKRKNAQKSEKAVMRLEGGRPAQRGRGGRERGKKVFLTTTNSIRRRT